MSSSVNEDVKGSATMKTGRHGQSTGHLKKSQVTEKTRLAFDNIDDTLEG